jgi:hypothetical protein
MQLRPSQRFVFSHTQFLSTCSPRSHPQVCGASGSPGPAVTLLKSYGIELVSEVYRELYIRGLIRAKKPSDYDPDRSSKVRPLETANCRLPRDEN